MKETVDQTIIANAANLYIPHGSDESIILCYLLRRLYLLYIPHGSDERDNLAKSVKDALNFISHMVQMKVLSYDRCLLLL